MKIIDYLKLMQLLQQHEISASFESFIKKDHHSVNSSVDIFSLAELRALVDKINAREARKKEEMTQQHSQALLPWKKGEFKLFLWVLSYYSFLTQLEIPSFNQKQYELFQSIFCRQSVQRLRYEVLCLYPPKVSCKCVWQEQEILLFNTVIQEHLTSNKKMEWKSISYELFSRTNGRWFKTNAQCRQRWLNHLNPRVVKNNWSRQEDYKLLVSIQTHGLRWAEVAKSFRGSRTEHMVKNRYLSLMNKWSRNKSKKTNKEIEMRIINTIKRNIERSAIIHSQEAININSSEEVNNESTINHQGGSNNSHHEIRQPIPPVVFAQQNILQESCVNSPLHCPYQEPESQPWGQKMLEYQPIGLRPNRYKDESLRQTIADIVEKLGCSHPEQIDMFFQVSSDWGMEVEQE